MRQIAILVLAMAAHLLSGGASALAVNFRATFESIKIQGRAGQVVNRSFQLTLGAEEQRTHFKARVEDWWPSEDGKQSFYREPGTLERSCGLWVALNPVEAAVDPGEILKIKITVSIPGDVEPGGHWCVLTVDETADPLTTTPSGVALRFLASVSVGIFVYVEPVHRAARITEVQILSDEAKIKLRNEGNAPLGVEGRLEFISIRPDRTRLELRNEVDASRGLEEGGDIRPEERTPTAVALIPRRTVLPAPIPSALLTAKLPDATVLPSGKYLVRFILDIGLENYIGVQKEMDIRRGISVTAETH